MGQRLQRQRTIIRIQSDDADKIPRRQDLINGNHTPQCHPARDLKIHISQGIAQILSLRIIHIAAAVDPDHARDGAALFFLDLTNICCVLREIIVPHADAHRPAAQQSRERRPGIEGFRVYVCHEHRIRCDTVGIKRLAPFLDLGDLRQQAFGVTHHLRRKPINQRRLVNRVQFAEINEGPSGFFRIQKGRAIARLHAAAGRRDDAAAEFHNFRIFMHRESQILQAKKRGHHLGQPRLAEPAGPFQKDKTAHPVPAVKPQNPRHLRHDRFVVAAQDITVKPFHHLSRMSTRMTAHKFFNLPAHLNRNSAGP